MKSLDLIGNIKKRKDLLEVISEEGTRIYLRPARINKEDAGKMALWRSKCYRSFFTWLKPDEEDVLRWLEQYERRNNDITFIMESDGHIPLGQMAVYDIDIKRGSAEFGRLIRGEHGGARDGITALAVRGLLEWVFDFFGLNEICLEVFADNGAAISLYEKTGFRTIEVLSFKKVIDHKGLIGWQETGESPKEGVNNTDQFRQVFKMALSPERFKKIVRKNFKINSNV